MSVKTRVVKFGGKSLASPALLANASRLVADDFGKENRLAVVVSAQGNTTDALISQLKEACGNAPHSNWDHVLSYGERLSAALFASSLESRGVPAVLFDPSKANWPVLSDSGFGDAVVDFDLTNLSVKLHVAKAMGSAVAVIPGFVARSVEGEITTLGRGGSDLSAFLLARCLVADEIVKVTNVDGFYLDGKRVESAGVEQLRAACSDDGAEKYERFNALIQPKALEHFVAPTVLRIISQESESLDFRGSVIYPHDAPEAAEES